MADVVIKLDLDGADGEKIRQAFAQAGDPEPALRDFGEYKRRRIILSMPRAPQGYASGPGMPPARHTGLLSQRIAYDVAGAKLEVGTNDVRAPLLQFGGTIRPRNAKFLTIPVSREAIGKRARDFDLDLIPREGKPWLLVRKRTRTQYSRTSGEKRAKSVAVKGLDVMFVLLKSVTIKPHPFLVWHPEDSNYLLTALQRQIEGAGK